MTAVGLPCVACTIPKSGTFLCQKLGVLLGYRQPAGGFGYLKDVTAEWESGCDYEGTLDPDGSPHGASLDGSVGLLELPGPRFVSVDAALLDRLRPGEMLFGHFLHTPGAEALFAASRVRLLIPVRDPRGVAVSHAAWAVANDWPLRELYETLPVEERVRRSLLGWQPDGMAAGVMPLVRRFRNMVGWLGSEAVLAVRFEDLVGPMGGGDLERHRVALRRVLDHLGCEGWPASRVDALGLELFGGTATFRSGQAAGWRRYESVFVEAEAGAAVKEILGLLAEAGLELPVVRIGRLVRPDTRVQALRIPFRLRWGAAVRRQAATARLKRLRRRLSRARKRLRRWLALARKTRRRGHPGSRSAG